MCIRDRGTGVRVEKLIRNQSESRPAWDGLAMNRWPQLTLTRRDREAGPLVRGRATLRATATGYRADVTAKPRTSFPTVPLREVVAALERLYPVDTASSWDRVGLVTGDLDRPISLVHFAVDP